MVFRNLKKLSVVFFIIATFCLIIKLSTVITVYPDEPTMILMIRTELGFDSFIPPPADFYSQKKVIIASDENSLLIEPIYFLIVSYLWWICYITALILYILYLKQKKRT